MRSLGLTNSSREALVLANPIELFTNHSLCIQTVDLWLDHPNTNREEPDEEKWSCEIAKSCMFTCLCHHKVLGYKIHKVEHAEHAEEVQWEYDCQCYWVGVLKYADEHWDVE